MLTLGLVLGFSGFRTLFSQPVQYARVDVEGFTIYPDLKDNTVFYYAPGVLYLASDAGGKPIFKLVQMRYTGTAATGNQGEVRYMNIVQFKVRMDEIGKAELDRIRPHLKPGSSLNPVPLRNLEAYLVAPFEGKYKRIGKSGSFQQDGTTTQGSYWTERTFTVRLENHEAQLLWDMVEDGNIALSVAYTYYADMIGHISGDAKASDTGVRGSILSDEFEILTEGDTVATTQILRAEAFNIDVDPVKFPEVLVQTDLNEGVPPSYPAMEVICFDFTEDLRPDLEMKTIEFEAIGVTGAVVRLRSEKFYRSNTDLHTRQIRFPYAVNMRKPLRYRVKEYSSEGGVEDTGWITRDSWVGGLDITSRVDDITFERRSIEFETDLDSFEDLGIESMELQLNYSYLEQPGEVSMRFTTSSLPVAVTTVHCDKNTAITYKPTWILTSGEEVSGQHQSIAVDNYAYILPYNGE
jgi:hypothetical protein